MTLHLKPVGPGNWAIRVMVLLGKWDQPTLYQRGMRVWWGGVEHRICEVLP